MGNFQPSDRKVAYYTFKNRMVCPVITSSPQPENISDIKLISENGNYFLDLNLKSETVLRIELLNTLGQKIKTQNLHLMMGKKIIEPDLENLPAGIYFLNVTTDRSTSCFKLITE